MIHFARDTRAGSWTVEGPRYRGLLLVRRDGVVVSQYRWDGESRSLAELVERVRAEADKQEKELLDETTTQ